MIKFTLSTLFVVAGTMFDYTKASQCHAVAFSGGGSKGAYESGVVIGFSKSAKASSFEWDVASGVSAGALNSAAISLWAPNEGAQMADWLESTWLSLTSNQIYKEWPLGIIDGLFNQPGVFDTTPLKTLVTRLLTEKGSFKR